MVLYNPYSFKENQKTIFDAAFQGYVRNVVVKNWKAEANKTQRCILV